MASSKATTVEAYLKELPADRRATISAVREVILKNLPAGYREAMGWGMICYGVPLETFADTYNGQPLCYAALASQKNYNSLYLMCAYDCDGKKPDQVERIFKAAGKKLDRGKSCIRFKTVDDLPLAELGKLIGQTSVKAFVAEYRKVKGKG